jgi:hypothetical protein
MRWKDRFKQRETKIVPVAEMRGTKCDFFVKPSITGSERTRKAGLFLPEV